MRYKVNGQELTLDRQEVRSAKRIVALFMKQVESLSQKRGRPTYYFTFLIVMHLLSQEALDHIDAQRLAMVMNGFADIRRARR